MTSSQALECIEEPKNFKADLAVVVAKINRFSKVPGNPSHVAAEWKQKVKGGRGEEREKRREKIKKRNYQCFQFALSSYIHFSLLLSPSLPLSSPLSSSPVCLIDFYSRLPSTNTSKVYHLRDPI